MERHDASSTLHPIWRRIGHKLKGEGLAFQAADGSRGFEALVVGTSDAGFVLYEPERREDDVFTHEFKRVGSVTPLTPTRTEELRATYERSRAAA